MKKSYEHFYKELFLCLTTIPTPPKANLTAKIISEENKIFHFRNIASWEIQRRSCSSDISYY